MKNLIIFCLLFTAALLSCVKEATIKLPKSETKLVVTCFISPDDTIIGAVVRESRPKFGAQQSFSLSPTSNGDIENATVVISDGIKSVTMPYKTDALNPLFSYYKTTRKQFPIVAGKTYYLFVSTPDGKSVNATTTVPSSKLPIDTFKVNITKNDSIQIEYDLDVTMNDIPNETNYVCVYFQNLNTANTPTNSVYYSYIDYFDNDEKLAKNQYHYQTSSTMYNFDTIRYAEIRVTALNCSKDFYLYSKSVNDARFGGNPLAEPVLVYTNITNGFGCFGGYIGNNRGKRIR